MLVCLLQNIRLYFCIACINRTIVTWSNFKWKTNDTKNKSAESFRWAQIVRIDNEARHTFRQMFILLLFFPSYYYFFFFFFLLLLLFAHSFSMQCCCFSSICLSSFCHFRIIGCKYSRSLFLPSLSPSPSWPCNSIEMNLCRLHHALCMPFQWARV